MVFSCHKLCSQHCPYRHDYLGLHQRKTVVETYRLESEISPLALWKEEELGDQL